MMGCKMPWWAGSETPPPDKDKIIADLRAEVASLKEDLSRNAEQRRILEEANEELHKQIASLALAARIASLQGELSAANGRVERMREALEIAYDHLLVHWTEEQLKTVVPLHKIPAALSDLTYEVPSFDERSSEVDKEKS